MEALLQTHFGPKRTSDERSFLFGNLHSERVVEFCTFSRVREALNSFKPMKTPGVDGVKPIILKILPENGIESLVAIY